MKTARRVLRPPKTVVGVDPGQSGAVVVTDGVAVAAYPMPLNTEGRVSFSEAVLLFQKIKKEWGSVHVFLERAVSFGMGAKSAFNYGRGFEALVVALELSLIPMTQVEPRKWAKDMHAGISLDLKPKVKSLIAAQRLFPQLVDALPKKPKGGVHDGMIDALLIAGYGLRRFGWAPEDVGDFI